MSQTERKPFSLQQLSSTDFEQFVFDLLQESGWQNVRWRKGTPLDSSPADHGRDIEGELPRRYLGGRVSNELWFVDCKRYDRGVPPVMLQNAIAWAQAERPRHLVFAASGFLSTGSHDFLDKLEANTKPPFEIHRWELPTLERMSAGDTVLRRRYGIGDELPYLALLHPAHAGYLRGSRTNTIEYLLPLLEALGQDWFDGALYTTMVSIVDPTEDAPRYGPKGSAGWYLPRVSFEEFRLKCLKLARSVDDAFLTYAIVSHVLAELFHLSDTTQLGNVRENYRKTAAFFRRPGAGLGKLTQAQRDDAADRWEADAELIPERFQRHRALYEEFCERVVRRLTLERLPPIELPPNDADS